MDADLFGKLVDEAIASIPEEFRSKLDNIMVEVMPLAPLELAAKMGHNPWGLLGVYEGVPYKQRGPWYGNVLPDRILIFQRPIELQARTAAQVRRLVRQVVIHEVGHYFGLSDEELHRLEAEADKNDAGSESPPSPQ